MKQIRIYYESLEQGANFIMPIIKNVIDSDTEIVLIRRPKTVKELNAGSISALFTMTTPDALITGIYDNKEYPLVMIEFTEAVTTEDHELQRIYGAIAAYMAGSYYLKLSGEKESEKEFGGAVYNPYSTPKIFIDEVGYEGYIIAKWETEIGNKYTLQHNVDYPSCPPKINIFSDTIQNAVYAFINNSTEWFENSLTALKQTDSYKIFRYLVNSATGSETLLNTWKNRKKSNLNKLRYFVDDDFIAVKLNRFSHAMDPDRGILTFISFLFSKRFNVYGIYALKRTREPLTIDIKSIDTMRQQTMKALEKDKKDGGGIPKWFENIIIQCVNNADNLTDEVDITKTLLSCLKKITENKVLMTIIYYSDGIRLNHNGILIKWNRKRLLNSPDRNFTSCFSERFGFTRYVAPTPTVRIVKEVNEDEVTYAIVHKVLIPNGFKIVAISYPGAQGGNAVLPYPELGKSQPRIYPDTLAIPPKGVGIDVLINESKGMFEVRDVEKDTAKVLMFKTEQVYKTALRETLLVSRVIDQNQQIKNIVVGVSFGIDTDNQTEWNPRTVDFIFRVVDRKIWAIGIFKQELSNIISTIEGSTDFPDIYECNKSI